MLRKDGTKTMHITSNGKQVPLTEIYACQKDNLFYKESQEQELVSKINHIDWNCKLYGKVVCGSCKKFQESGIKERKTLNENN